jgi:hypothetical protein
VPDKMRVAFKEKDGIRIVSVDANKAKAN